MLGIWGLILVNTIVDYQIAAADSPLKLQNMVNLFIEKGWKPMGGISVGLGLTIVYAQAMVRYEN
jgi:hypothetical protein